MIIAIDGLASSGKGTLSVRLAKKYHLPYLNTGALYRAIAYKANEINQLDNVEKIIDIAKSLTQEDINNSNLYNEGVGVMASKIAKISLVRKALLSYQKNFIIQNFRGAIIDGRDIGTVICPNADCKLYITASIEERAQRRYDQLKKTGAKYNEVLERLKIRDENDINRSDSPLAKSVDAFEINTDGMSIEEVFKKAVNIIEKVVSKKQIKVNSND